MDKVFEKFAKHDYLIVNRDAPDIPSKNGLTDEDEKLVAERKKAWLPKKDPDPGDSPAVAIADPVKTGLLRAIMPALIAGSLGSVAGLGFSNTPKGMGIGALAGLLGGGGLAWLAHGYDQSVRNRAARALLREYSKWGDMEADKAFQEELRHYPPATQRLRYNMAAIGVR